MHRTGETLSEIVEQVQQAAGFVASIAQAASEQATGVSEVNSAISQMDAATQQNSAMVEETTAATKTIEMMASAMAEKVEFFRVDGFSSTSRGSSGGFETAPAMTLEDTDELPPMAEDEPQVTAIAIPEDFGAGSDGGGNDDWEEF